VIQFLSVFGINKPSEGWDPFLSFKSGSMWFCHTERITGSGINIDHFLNSCFQELLWESTRIMTLWSPIHPEIGELRKPVAAFVF